MTPEEMGIAYLCIVPFVFAIIALAIGYGFGYVEGKASRKIWTEQEIKDRINQN